MLQPLFAPAPSATAPRIAKTAILIAAVVRLSPFAPPHRFPGSEAAERVKTALCEKLFTAMLALGLSHAQAARPRRVVYSPGGTPIPTQSFF